jgi:hypothetical protein
MLRNFKKDPGNYIICRIAKRGFSGDGGARRGRRCLKAKAATLNRTKSWRSHSKKVLEYFRRRLDNEVELFDKQIYYCNNGGK